MIAYQKVKPINQTVISISADTVNVSWSIVLFIIISNSTETIAS